MKYELKAVVVHRGGPYGGHYFAYMKDDLGQGNWNINMPEKFDERPTEKEVKQEETKEEPQPE